MEHGFRILLAEDNPAGQQIAVAMLRRNGFLVDAVSSGAEAVEAFLRCPYDAILMDCQMPVMNGFEATQAIRCMEERDAPRRRPEDAPRLPQIPRSLESRRIPIIALSGSSMESGYDDCLAAGMDDYLCKPFSQRQLISILVRWLPSEAMPVPERPLDARGRRGPINPAAVENIRRLEHAQTPDILARVIRSYIGSASQLLFHIRSAVLRNDPTDLWKTAHNLKSSSAHVGAWCVSDVSRELETIGKAGSVQGASDLLLRLEREYERACEALCAMLAGGEQ